MNNPSANANDQRPTLVGWLIAALICAVLIGGVWLAVWLIGGRDARSATGITVAIVLFVAFRAEWNGQTVRGDDGNLVLRPKPKYGFRWVIFWAGCFLGFAGLAGMVCVTEDPSQSGPQLGIAILSVLALLTLSLCLRLLWPRFTLHPPRVELSEKTKNVVRGAFHQPCKRKIEHAAVTIKVGYEQVHKSRVSDPEGEPGKKRTVVNVQFVVLAEKTLPAELNGDGSEQEIVVPINFALRNAPKNLVIETQTAFGGSFDYRARF